VQNFENKQSIEMFTEINSLKWDEVAKL